jgi:hypothetical protein
MADDDKKVVRLIPMAGFERVDGLTIDSSVAMIMRLPFKPKERKELSVKLNSPIKRNEAVENLTIPDDEKAKREAIELERRLNKTYDGIFNPYNKKIEARFSGEDKKPINYGTIWNDLERKELDQNNQIAITYIHRVGKLLGPRTKKAHLTSKTLEDIAKAKKKVGKDFYAEISQEDEMKFKALVDLSIKAIMSYISDETDTLSEFSNKKEADEAKELLTNTYLALYIAGEHIDDVYHDLFFNIGNKGRNLRDEKTREVAKYVGELRRHYAIGPETKYGKRPIRSSTAIAQELDKRKQQENMDRLDLEVRTEELR